MKFHNHNGENEVETLIAIMAKLPGLGPRSARRAVIRMLEKKEIILEPNTKIKKYSSKFFFISTWSTCWRGIRLFR